MIGSVAEQIGEKIASSEFMKTNMITARMECNRRSISPLCIYGCIPQTATPSRLDLLHISALVLLSFTQIRRLTPCPLVCLMFSENIEGDTTGSQIACKDVLAHFLGREWCSVTIINGRGAGQLLPGIVTNIILVLLDLLIIYLILNSCD